jgi:hypothetical protein
VLGREEFIAPKGDPIWTAISRFGLPYAPFDFNSGMILRPVRRDKIPKDDDGNPVLPSPDFTPAPDSRPMAPGMQAAARVTHPPLREALRKSLGSGAEWTTDPETGADIIRVNKPPQP